MSNKVIIFDLETTVQNLNGTKDNSPFNPENRIVSAHWRMLEDGVLGTPQHSIFYHNEQAKPDSPDAFIEALKSADVGVAHNAKYDVLYLIEAGLPVPEEIYCTMIGEYIFARAQQVDKSLKATAERRDVTRKKSDLVDDLFKSGTGFEAMPLDTVIEYADADVLSCAEIYMQQQEDLQLDENKCLLPVFELMNEMLLFLAEIEANGIMIDLDELGKVETEFVAEKKAIEQRLKDTVTEVMGDTPINFNSGADMSKVIYSRELKDKEHWRRIMNLGTGANGKPLPPARMSQSQFVQAVRVNCEKVYRTIAYHCDACKGTGKIRKLKKDGKPYKNLSKCSSCDGQGFTLMSNGKIAGLKMSPSSTADCSVHGFKTDKVTLKRLIGQAMDKDNLQAVQFLTDITRLNAISTYLDSFVKNIQMYTRPDGRLHAQFNQTITRTGRLSSSYPNFQNLPKGGKFPVRKAIVSRWASEGGAIMEMDFSGLEFRVAGELSRDPQIIEDILGGKDVHKQTASIINQCSVDDVTKDMRQAAKAYTFAPLYGGMGAGEPEHVQTYFREYFNIYQGLKRWHSTLMDGVLKNGIVRTPSGREFMFKGAKRLRNGRITNATAVVNYPVQSFATADIVPLSCVRALRRFRKDGLKSKIILTVHDSIVVDVAPFEQPAVYEALRWAMQDVGEELQERFGYTPVLPLDTEAELGENWMETTTVSVDS